MENTQIPLYTAAQTRELDRLAIEQEGIAGYTLMSRAAAGTFQHIMSNWPNCQRMIVLCGIGNNGGDGYLIAKMALARGLQVQVFQLGDIQKQKGDALTARLALLESGLQISRFADDTVLETDVIVDALLGTGLQRAVDGVWLSAIRAINRAEANTVAVDIPSGLHADTGCQLNEAVKADLTVTFIGRKQGLYTADGRTCCGRVEFDSLGVPAVLYDQLKSDVSLLPLKLSGPLLNPRTANGHKGFYGHVLIIGGAPGMSGAVTMAASAALRSGCGLVSVATHPSHSNSINQAQPEIMSHGVDDESDLQVLINKADVIVVGPGLGQIPWSKLMLNCAMESGKPLIIDADALNLLSQFARQNNHWILTPHPGEAARLLNCSIKEIQQDRFLAIKALQKKYSGVCLLKGSGTLVYNGQMTKVCAAGNPGMASAGMGDVLSGIIAGLLAQARHLNVSLFEVACFAANLHGLAGNEAAKAGGEKGMLATDLLPYVRRLINENQTT